MNKKVWRIIFLVLIVALFSASNGYSALEYKHYKETGRVQGLEDRFFNKIQFLLKNKKELGLTPAQTAKINDLKTDIAKKLMKNDAQENVLKVDVGTGLWEAPPNTPVIDELVGKMHELQQEDTKTLLNGFYKIHEILSAEQNKEYKNLWHKSRS